ncbi:MAG: HEAT repeat domain-containing protein [Nitrospiraceae bacterium]
MAVRLEALLSDKSSDVRRTAAESLGKIGSRTSARALVDVLSDEVATVRQASAVALGRFGNSVGDQAGMPLLLRLTDQSDAVRTSAARAISEFGETPAVVDRLEKLLRSPDVRTRRATVLALQAIDTPVSFSVLAEALRDHDPLVRQGAVAALGELADARAIPLFRARLQHDVAVGVRSEAAFRLGKIGDRTVVVDLEKAAERDPNAEVRRWAQWARQELSS